MGASAEGLEVLNKQGQWVGITAIPGALVVNVGDMLQRLTNGCLKSTTHRVVNPPKEQWGLLVSAFHSSYTLWARCH